MSDGRKRLSGAEYKKRAKQKLEEQERILKQTKKLDVFFKASKESENKLSVDETVEESDADVVAGTSFFDTPISVAESTTTTTSQNSQNDTIVSNDFVVESQYSTEEPKLDSYFNKDPALWILNDTTKNLIATNGFDQNIELDFSNSLRTYKDQNRYLSKSLFERRLKNGEVYGRKWMIFSKSKGAVFCGPCLLFYTKERSQFDNKDGFNDWKNGESCACHHENSPIHKSSIITLKARGLALNRVDSMLTSQLDRET